MFMTSLNLASGLAAAARLLSAGSTSDTALVYTLHTGAFVAAAPVALAGIAFFVAAAGLSFRAGAFPRWLAWTAVLAAVVNVGALGGIFSLTGPLNASDGAIGGPAAPILAWAVWILLASIVMLRESRRSPVMPPNHPRPVRARRPPDQCAHEHR